MKNNYKKGRWKDPKYEIFHKSVLRRDNYQCQFPGCNYNQKLHVHHIKKYSEFAWLRTEKYNGITLCDICHDKVTGNEDLYEAIFFAIVRKNSKGEFRKANFRRNGKKRKATCCRKYHRGH